MHFYEILKEIMEEKSLSIPDVARSTGLSDSTVRSIILRKTKTVSLEVAFKMAKGLNVSLERLNGIEPVESKVNKYLNREEVKLLEQYSKLDSVDKNKVTVYIGDLSSSVKYFNTKEDN